MLITINRNSNCKRENSFLKDQGKIILIQGQALLLAV